MKGGRVQLLIGLGANQGDAAEAFLHAVERLRERVRVLACSGLWRSAPLGPPQSDYTNATALVETAEHPGSLLALCQALEKDAGRDRTREERWGPRPLDLDLLIAPGVVISSPALELPHPRLAQRRFALAPAAEFVPDWVHPRLLRTLGSLAGAPALARQRCERIGPFPGG
jgi:2-amino-4-hydroxy-6-hydroxymethyldihydropteridine diphosphokinase